MKGNFTFRLKYEKAENARYISHLDFVRVLNRTIRRSGLPVTYTEGFNPHPVMVVALPISVGVTGEDEYIDIDFDENPGEDVVLKVFKETFPEGIEILAAKLVTGDMPSFKTLDSAEYICEIETEGTPEVDISAFLAQDEIIVTKKTKSSEKEVDIKNDIKNLTLLEKSENYLKFSVKLPAGNTYNLKPELVFGALSEFSGFCLSFIKTHRTALFSGDKRFI